MSLVKNLIIIFFGLALTGCSTYHHAIQNRENQELRAQNIPPLRIPPGVASSSFQNLYPIPERHYPPLVKNINPEPPGLDG